MGSTGIVILLPDRLTADPLAPCGGRLHRRRTDYGQIGLGRLMAGQRPLSPGPDRQLSRLAATPRSVRLSRARRQPNPEVADSAFELAVTE